MAGTRWPTPVAPFPRGRRPVCAEKESKVTATATATTVITASTATAMAATRMFYRPTTAAAAATTGLAPWTRATAAWTWTASTKAPTRWLQPEGDPRARSSLWHACPCMRYLHWLGRRAFSPNGVLELPQQARRACPVRWRRSRARGTRLSGRRFSTTFGSDRLPWPCHWRRPPSASTS